MRYIKRERTNQRAVSRDNTVRTKETAASHYYWFLFTFHWAMFPHTTWIGPEPPMEYTWRFPSVRPLPVSQPTSSKHWKKEHKLSNILYRTWFEVCSHTAPADRDRDTVHLEGFWVAVIVDHTAMALSMNLHHHNVNAILITTWKYYSIFKRK